MILSPISALGEPFGNAAPVTGVDLDGVSVRERADFGCILCSAAVDPATVSCRLSGIISLEWPRCAGAFASDSRCTAIWLSPRAWLIQCRLEDEWPLVREIEARFSDKTVHACLFTDYLGWLELAGPSVPHVCAQAGFISLESGGLPVGHAKRTLFADIPAVVVHRSSHDGLVGVERSRLRYLVDWLASISASDVEKRNP